MLRRLTILALTVALAALATPASADGHCRNTQRQGKDSAGLVETCDPHTPKQTSPVAPRKGPVVTCTPRGGGSEFSPSRITEHADGSVWLSVPHNCSDGTTQRRRTCVDNCPVGAARTGTTVPGLRLEALAKIDPPLPGMRHSFDRPAANGQIRAIVLAETWWWSEGSYDPVVVRAEDGPLWVQVTATPGSMTIDPGDGSQPLVCPAPGVAYNRHASYYDQIPGERRGACVHVYGQTFNEVTATMAVTWTVTWEGYSPSQGSVGGTLAPMVRRQQVSFPVREIQSVIVY